MPGLSRASTFFAPELKTGMARSKPGHDDVDGMCPTHGSARSSSPRASPLSNSTAPYMLA